MASRDVSKTLRGAEELGGGGGGTPLTEKPPNPKRKRGVQIQIVPYMAVRDLARFPVCLVRRGRKTAGGALWQEQAVGVGIKARGTRLGHTTQLEAEHGLIWVPMVCEVAWWCWFAGLAV